jgi:ATP phosphoribosyltransferase
MTPEARLSQVEKLLETAARYIDRHSQAIEQNREEIRQLRTSMNEVLQLFSDLAAYQRQNQEIIRQNQEEIRRIWEYLLNQSGNGRSGN